ncbi:MAG: hypothetical protein Q4C72_10335 [Eubacteriales bacterium]|nr:hypothetical protein [Eubacteriales bacterium]
MEIHVQVSFLLSDLLPMPTESRRSAISTGAGGGYKKARRRSSAVRGTFYLRSIGKVNKTDGEILDKYLVLFCAYFC